MRSYRYLWPVSTCIILIIILVIIINLINTEYAAGLNSYLQPLVQHSWISAEKTITFVFVLSIILIAILIILENRNPHGTIAWLLVLLVFPVFGFILYILTGRNMRKKRKVKKHLLDSDTLELESVIENRLMLLKKTQPKLHQNIKSHRKLINLIRNNSSEPLTINNRCQVLTNGDETFAAILDAISKARKHIHLEYYIVRPDNIGYRIQQALIKKAKQGVEIRFLYDAVGGRKLGANYLRPLQEAGVQLAAFLPVKFPFLRSRINYRNHRKIIVIDGTIGFIGGLNIGDEYLGCGKLGFWRDTHIKLDGESAYSLQHIFLHDWHFATRERIQTRKYFTRIPPRGIQPVQITASGPDSEWANILQSHFTAIVSARDKIYIASPYFVPDESILMALKTAALSGVDTRLILPNKPDHRIVFWASMSYVKEIIAAGVKVYLYQKGFMHAKILLIDGVVASVGTTNMDLRSFNLNFEINALIYDKKIAGSLEEGFYRDFADSKLITYEEWIKRGFWTHFKESSARLLSPIL